MSLRSPLSLVAVVALALAMAGSAVAGNKVNKDEVTLVTLTGGPVSTTGPFEDVPIPLNGAATFSFTQKPGEVVHLVARTDLDAGTSTLCDVEVSVFDTVSGTGIQMSDSTDKGGEGSGVDGLPAPGSDTPVTLRAVTTELETCDDPDVGGGEPDTWTVSVRVSVVTLRN